MPNELTAAIDAFLERYPPDVDLEWRDPPRKPRTLSEQALHTMVGDLVAASERAKTVGPR